jgi:nickel-type superoxide dismutase maturation protease
MAPALAAGERVFVSRAAYWFSKPRPGDLVVVRDPRQHDRLLLKRIDQPVGDDRWSVLGDNPEASTDSRTFGPVPRGLILGKVWFRY